MSGSNTTKQTLGAIPGVSDLLPSRAEIWKSRFPCGAVRGSNSSPTKRRRPCFSASRQACRTPSSPTEPAKITSITFLKKQYSVPQGSSGCASPINGKELRMSSNHFRKRGEDDSGFVPVVFWGGLDLALDPVAIIGLRQRSVLVEHESCDTHFVFFPLGRFAALYPSYALVNDPRDPRIYAAILADAAREAVDVRQPSAIDRFSNEASRSSLVAAARQAALLKSLAKFARNDGASLRRLARTAALPWLAIRLLQHRGQKLPGVAPRRFHDVFRRTPGDDFAAAVAAFGA
jgi:hypothetical protein